MSMAMEYPPIYNVGKRVLVVADSAGWYHGVGDGREVEIKKITPLPEIQTYEYEVMDNEGDFWHIPEKDLL